MAATMMLLALDSNKSSLLRCGTYALISSNMDLLFRLIGVGNKGRLRISVVFILVVLTKIAQYHAISRDS